MSHPERTEKHGEFHVAALKVTIHWVSLKHLDLKKKIGEESRNKDWCLPLLMEKLTYRSFHPGVFWGKFQALLPVISKPIRENLHCQVQLNKKICNDWQKRTLKNKLGSWLKFSLFFFSLIHFRSCVICISCVMTVKKKSINKYDWNF